MKVSNMTSDQGNKIANQFIISDIVIKLDVVVKRGTAEYRFTGIEGDVFQSYDSIIALISYMPTLGKVVILDSKYWDYSRNTGKYRNIFLGEKFKETQAKINDGTYTLTNLNK